MKRKTTIEIDVDLLAQAQDVLGTRGLKDTVDMALSEVIRTRRHRELAKQLATGAGLDFDQSTRRAARRWRT
jgi:Arc/MetJ family transcription regulator